MLPGWSFEKMLIRSILLTIVNNSKLNKAHSKRTVLQIQGLFQTARGWFGEDFFRALPSGPGVHLMRGATEGVLYVGKARNLRKRLAS